MKARLVTVVVGLGLLGAGAAAVVKFAGDAAVVTRPPEPLAACDAGDEAWIRQVVPFLLGRPPAGLREVRVLTDLVGRVGRGEAARLLARGPDYESRWADWLLDETHVNRAGPKSHPECYARPLTAGDDGALARTLRERGPRDAGAPAGPFNMADVVRSSLRLDDVTPYYRARLFSLLSRPILLCRNISDLDNELARRRNVGDLFAKVYAHRNIDCLTCHNSDYSVTKRADPARNRFHAVPGSWEESLFGARRGRPMEELFASFRFGGVVTSPDPTAPPDPRWQKAKPTDPALLQRPWNLDEGCGTFAAPDAVVLDPAGAEGFLGAALGKKTSVWDVEALLRRGVDELAGRPSLPGVEGEVPAPHVALASMLALRIAHQAWEEAFGTQLTVAHFFPRTADQRDVLMSLASALVAHRWSLRELLVAIVTHPLYNPAPPEAGCGTAYPDPVVFNAWSLEETVPERRGNGVGDTVHRADSRELVKGLSGALGWPKPATFPESFEEQIFLGRSGAFVSDGLPGYAGVSFQGMLAWENRFGACLQPLTLTPSDPAEKGADLKSCLGRCGRGGEGDRNQEACWCDVACGMHGDCCGDFEALCIERKSERVRDWLDRLGDEVRASGAAGLTVGDLASAVKDRLLATPDIEPDEAPLVAALFGAEALSTPLPEVEGWQDGARRFCGVLAKSPEFLLRRAPVATKSPPPKLVVGGEDYRALCTRWQDAAAARGLRLDCGADRLEVRRVGTGWL